MKPLELSLKTLVPRRWDIRFKCLYYYSTILRYGVPESPNSLSPEFLKYVRELCAATLCLIRTALSSYETMTSHSSRGDAPFVFVCARCSCLDAMAAVIVAALTKTISPPTKIPGLANLGDVLKKAGKPLMATHAANLSTQAWCKLLYETRHKMIHRGYWFAGRAYPSGPSGTYLIRTPGLLESSGHRTLPVGHTVSEWEETDFQAIAKGLFLSLERWTLDIHDALKAEEGYSSSYDCLMHWVPLEPADQKHESLGYLTKEQSREILCPVSI